MSTKVTVGSGAIGAGEIKFYDSIQPPLTAGSYTLQATQTIQNLPGQKDDPTYVASQQLRVDGPRFTLDPSQISSVFPPANQLGNFDNDLPHIVFNNFALPWSREINPLSQDINQIPWMGLLTLYPDDMPSMTNVNPNVSPPQTITVSELIHPSNAKVLPPDLGDTIYEPDSTKVTVVDVNLAFFQAIAPSLDELPFLAHGRQVNTDGKVMLGMDADGCFSLLVGNRLPMATDDGITKNTIYLVSYEGHQDHLHGSTISGDYNQIRLVLLGSWEFSAAPARGSFIQLMEDLCDKGRGGVTLYQMPKQQTNLPLTPNVTVDEALDIGYVALQNNMRVGENATSWYRGPLVPAPTKRDFSYGPYIFSDHAMQYDPGTGIFNHAYSAAWQIGRLLALSDATFAQQLFQWRMDYITEINNDAKNEEIQLKASAMMAPEANGAAVNMVSATQSLMATKLSKVKWPKVTPRTQTTLGDHLPGIMNSDEVSAIHQSGEDPLIELSRKLKGGSGKVKGAKA
ncbi:hypothetical protein BTA51_14550 [Hahella sp. CCB-MM4]|uniref:hypothetical protein n=1 Tax=Hahella sp. (strain CCB-MM4) TaxID=1926491 RepID=UPI000B9A4D29|nr:hypothetical protein [Hahella sp. CCB-MM4]OZG72740.1 hypothetical protein BTA51_14550 [Hahella sp. CCB-MM4]